MSMDYIQKIFKRAKVKNVVDHLLYGYEPDMDIPDYESRMEEAFAQYGETIHAGGIPQFGARTFIAGDCCA